MLELPFVAARTNLSSNTGDSRIWLFKYGKFPYLTFQIREVSVQNANPPQSAAVCAQTRPHTTTVCSSLRSKLCFRYISFF